MKSLDLKKFKEFRVEDSLKVLGGVCTGGGGRRIGSFVATWDSDDITNGVWSSPKVNVSYHPL